MVPRRHLPAAALLALLGCGDGSRPGDTGEPAEHSLAPEATGLDCSEDDVVGLAKRGGLRVGRSGTIIPLCSGELLLSDQGALEIQRLELRSGEVLEAWQLPAPPERMLHDRDEGLLIASHGSSVTAIDPEAGESWTHHLDAPILDITMGNNGTLFANIGDNYGLEIAVIDAREGIEGSYEVPVGGTFLAFDRTRDLLYAADAGWSPSDLIRLTWEGGGFGYQESIDGGTNGQGLALSPDGEHIAFPCGGGNGPGYLTYDFSAQDLERVLGAFDTGPYPRAAAFDADSARLAASNGDEALLFDVETHEQVDGFEMPWGSCDYGTVSQVGVSTGSRILFGYGDCGYEDSAGVLSWMVVD